MKAHYTSFPDKRSQRLYADMSKDMQERFAILYEKVLIHTLNQKFGWGVKRIKELVDEMNAAVDEMHNSPTFWDKVDEVVIKKMGFDYPKCDYEYMEKVFYKPPEISMQDKRAAVADMAKMREFLGRDKNE